MDKFQNKKIVAIGGGHGLGRLLSALRIFAENVTGIVAITDNGGSTGRLRQCQGGIAWGDTRNCINQLITEPSVESIMFEYRFKGQGELDGHNLGNLMLTALNNLSVRPLEAIRLISSLLKIKVNIIPMSEHPSDLKALTQHNTWIHGETNIDQIQQPIKELDLQPHIPATPEAIDAITAADCIILGPGSFLTSIMPPLLLSEIGTAISLNTSAKVIFIDNLGSETGPAGTMTLIEKLNWCENACQSRQIDHVISQSETTLPCKWHLHQAHLASDHRAWRHDRNKLRQAIMDLF